MVRARLCCPVVCLCVALLVGAPAWAKESAPARPIELSVDATEAPRKLLHARQVIPAAPGQLTLYYPKWIPGEHSPTGPVTDLSGVKFRAGGKPLAWRRDDVDLFAFHCTVPEGADAVEVALDYLGPTHKEGFTSGGSMTSRLAVLSWNQVLLYPKGHPARDLKVRANLTIPSGWKLGTALPVADRKGDRTQFETVSLETLIDSPVLCGAHFKEVPLGPKDGPPHYLVLACDSAAGLELSPALKGHYERLVAEAGALFGARHYRSYRFLVTMSDHVAHFAEEHHECSDNRMPERFLLDDKYRKLAPAWVLSHEYVHSWNGKYRRPAGLATPDYQQPMRTRLLWVYEGLTEYLGFVLAARSGLHAPALARENLAVIAEWAGNQKGRTWRPLEDTAVMAPRLYFARPDWASRRRGVDFYDEGALLWLDVDTQIRKLTAGKRSLDDFCRAFFRGTDGSPEVKPYEFKDVVAALDGVARHDWKAFLRKRLEATTAEPPLEGLTGAGWELVYEAKPGDLITAREEEDKVIDLTASVGLLLKDDGTVVDVVPHKAADKAGVGPGMKLLAVNRRRFSAERLKAAVTATAGGQGKLSLLFENDEYFQTFTPDYRGGARYPRLKRIADKPDLLAKIFKPRAAKGK
jgi:predicted metalloprotease with PDZ domain